MISRHLISKGLVLFKRSDDRLVFIMDGNVYIWKDGLNIESLVGKTRLMITSYVNVSYCWLIYTSDDSN